MSVSFPLDSGGINVFNVFGSADLFPFTFHCVIVLYFIIVVTVRTVYYTKYHMEM